MSIGESTAVADTAAQLKNAGGHTSRWVGWVALVVAFIALGLAIRQPRQA